jgi:hypothetical protein
MIKTLAELSNWITLEAVIDTQLKLDIQALFWEHPSVDTGRTFWCVSGGLIEVDWAALLTSSNPQ